MLPELDTDHVFYSFSPKLKPALCVKQHQEFILKTMDCFSGQIRSEQDILDRLDWEQVNPATGPVYIEGAGPGDIIGFDILEIKPGPDSRVVVAKDEGVPQEIISKTETAILKHEDNYLNFKNLARIPVNPMIGVIGVAPRDREIPNGTPEKHGGNMDCKIITAGCRIYFEVEVEGALFGCGDLHTAQGDGEIGVSGAETPGEVRVKGCVYPELKGLPTPFVETQDIVATICSARTSDEAAKNAVDNMIIFLNRFAHIPENHAAMLMSMAGNLRFCQIVDPLKTVRFELPKSVLPALEKLHG
ncbi:MAG: acetamidase/formamidase family protein [Desulfonatronovibrio sp.]